MLGMEPIGQHLLVEPELPERFGSLQLLDVPGAWGRADAFGRGLIPLELERLDPVLLGTTVSRASGAGVAEGARSASS
jgi:hypothetical protein